MSDINLAKSLIEAEDYRKATELLLPYAQEGIAEAQYLLGYLYFTSADVSFEESYEWLQKAVAQDHPAACYYLAIIYQRPDGLVEVGQPYDETTRHLLLKAAHLGCMEAQRDVGCFYALGEAGFPLDERQARTWYLKASHQGHAEAQCDLASMYRGGEGGPIDSAEALKWDRIAAEQAYAPAQFSLGCSLIGGYDGVKEVSEGLRWLTTCALRSDLSPMSKHAAVKLSEIYAQGTPEIDPDEDEARKWKQHAKAWEEAWAAKEAERDVNEELCSMILAGPTTWQRAAIQALLVEGADVNALTDDQCPMLYAAAFRGLEDITKLLIEHGAIVDVPHPENNATPLHAAAYNGHKAVVVLLLAHGASLYRETTEGQTARALALQQGFLDIAELLVDNKTDVDGNGAEKRGEGS